MVFLKSSLNICIRAHSVLKTCQETIEILSQSLTVRTVFIYHYLKWECVILNFIFMDINLLPTPNLYRHKKECA